MTTYTDADVQELVRDAQAVLADAKVYREGEWHLSQTAITWVSLGNLRESLKPFDRDTELAQIVKGICHGQNYSGDERWHHIIQVVREHDAKVGVK